MYKKLFDRDAKSAAGALVVLLYGVIPMFAFGSLLAAIGSHPEVVAVLKNEAAYRYAAWWDGGMKWIPVWFGATAVGSLFCGGERLMRAVTARAEWKYMPRVRQGVKDYTLKPFLSALAFVDGLMVNDPRACIAVFLIGAVLAFWSLHLLKVSESQ
ncbi:hypothetical protein ACV229_36590 [Burkholderia sp. MR1-5-21]